MQRLQLLLLPLLLASAGCGGINLFTTSQDVNLGRQMHAEILANPQEYPILRDSYITGYVQGIVNEITASDEIRYRGTFPYTVTIIDDDRTLNAFATPGGYIYVYTGLLRYLDNKAALAGVLAHEIAHAEERHGTEHMTQQLGLDVAMSMALGDNPGELTRLVANSGAMLGVLANSRADETEADERGFAYLQDTPYWEGGIKLFFEKMLLQQGNRAGGPLGEWTSTHPLPQSRVEDINALMKANQTPPPTPGNLMAEDYRQMLRRLN